MIAWTWKTTGRNITRRETAAPQASTDFAGYVRGLKMSCVFEKPERFPGSTHWAVTPSGEVLYYSVSDEVMLWHPFSGFWDKPGLVPYTLYSFDEVRT